MPAFLQHLRVYRHLLALRSYRRRVLVTILAFFGGTASVGQLFLWVLGISGGVELTATLLILVPIGAAVSLRLSIPSADILFRHTVVDSTVRVSVGNIFETSGSAIVITMNRHFDTAPALVSPESLVAQLIKGPLAGRPDMIQECVSAQLPGELDGPRRVGEIVQVPGGSNTYLLLALAERNADTSSSVATDAVWLALSELWQFARRHNLKRLRLPVVGSGYARAHVGRVPLLVLLLSSYLTSALEWPICDLEVVLHPDDADPDLLELAKSYCEILGFSATEQRYFTERDLVSGQAGY